MLTFAHPEWLLLLTALPWVLWSSLRQTRPALLLPRAELFAARRSHWPRWGVVIGRALVVAFLALAAAGPRLPDLKTRLPSEGIAIALVMDVSGSMAAPDFPGIDPPTRLNAAKQTFQSFIDRRGQDAIALVAFAATPRTECPPTLNHSVLKVLVEKLEPRAGVDAGTNIGDAIAEALLRLQASPAKRKAIILLSDGEHNATGEGADAPLTPRQAAQLAANLHVPLYAIDCGGEPVAPDAMEQRAAGRAILQTSAELTGGNLFVASDMAKLAEAMNDIDTLERTTIESFQYRRYFEFGYYCGLAALALGMLSCLLEATLWRTLP